MKPGTYITQIYCRNQQCNARECEVVTKYHGDNPEPEIWHCPSCGAEAVVHWRRDLMEHAKHELQEALGRVNAYLYARDQKTGAVPVNILCLREAPDSWRWVSP